MVHGGAAPRRTALAHGRFTRREDGSGDDKSAPEDDKSAPGDASTVFAAARDALDLFRALRDRKTRRRPRLVAHGGCVCERLPVPPAR